MGVLDDMTKGITDRKAKAAGPKLTPVGLETSPVKPSMPSDLPNAFMAAEVLADYAKDLRKKAGEFRTMADYFEQVATGLDELTGFNSTPVVDPKVAAAEEKRAQERAADERIRAKQAEAEAAKPEPLPELDVAVEEGFKERLDRLSTEAQAAAFASLDADEPEEPAKPAGWTCPDHGASNLKQLESRRGRRYMACQIAGCREFEKE